MTRAGCIVSALVAGAAQALAGGLWLDVPFVKQVENGCGAAVISMTMQYWSQHGAAIDPAAADASHIQSELYSAERKGILASAIRQYLEDYGFQTIVFRGKWDDLGEHLAKGRPLIVATRQGRESHYVVVAGVSDNGVEVNDPGDRKLRKVSRAEFERKWRGAGNWTLLAVPRPVS